MGRKWRQRPIACQSCRRRKIRCSREFPCSNCTSRGIKCIQFYEPQEPGELDAVAAAADTRAGSVASHQLKLQPLLPELSLSRGGTEPISALFPNADIQARLDRLENWITGLNIPAGAVAPSLSWRAAKIEGARSPLQEQQVPSDTLVRHLSQLEISTLRQITAEAVWFGSNLIMNKPQMMLTSSFPTETFYDATISFHLSPIKLIKKPCCILQDVSASQMGAGSRQICVFLPMYHEACTIFHTFTSDWTVLSPTIHTPTLFTNVQNVYTCVQEQMQVPLDELLLFLAMVACATHASSLGDDMSRLFEGHVDATSRCPAWIDSAFHISDEIKRRGLTSLVSLQAQTILMKVSCYMEGSSVRNRSLVSTSIAMAREMGIHRVDLPGETRLGLKSEVEVEIARRVWWDNVTIDWFLALFPGPQEGVYTIHPHHMAVNKPSKVAGRDADQQTLPPNGRTEQTDVSYFVVRIRLAEISREFVDSCPISPPSTHEHKQEKLHEFNAKLEELQRDLPGHLVLRKPGDLLDPPCPQPSALVFQSLHINCLIYIKRCIVHLRFLSFASVDSRFSFSYEVCFHCARDIICMFKTFKANHPGIMLRLRATSSLRALLLASAVFLLDMCSGVEIDDLHRQRPEMIDAWRLMGEMEEDSNLIEQFLDFASQMLTKYHISEAIVSALSAATSSGSVDAPSMHRDLPQQPQQEDACMYAVPGDQTQTNMSPMDDGLGTSHDMPMDPTQRWQTLDADFDIKTMSWDNVLWGFDTVLM